MTTYKGLDGFLALGGALTGTPLLTATLTTGATELNVTGGGSTLTGVLCLGDIFTLGGETNTPKYRVKTTCYAATGTAILTTIPFEPGVSEEIAEDASLTVQANSMAEARLWNLTAGVDLLDDTVFQDKWKSFKGDKGEWSGSVEALLDMADLEQASLINAIASPANLMAYPLDFSNWSSVESPLLTTNINDPFNGSGAFTLEDNGAVNNERIYATAVFTTDGEKGLSLYVKEGTTTVNELRLITSAATIINRLRVTWVDNEPVLRSMDGGGEVQPPEAIFDDWWLVKWSATNVLAASTNHMEISPGIIADGTNTGSMSIYGAKASDAPYVGTLDTQSPLSPTVAMMFGVATDKQFYGYAKLSNLAITAQKGELVTITYDFTGTGALRPNWT